jgi:alkanesulfonate monooxygenase SsuD/methylene tetrahydromethanopterin reductase-like flavin-dependent oxidoreductase (luciferase family)
MIRTHTSFWKGGAVRLSISFTGFGALESTMPVVLAAEEAGFDGVWTAEHLGFHDAVVPSVMYLRATERLEIGLVGLSTAGRHPGMTAMELASLSEIGPGRVRVQVGTGDPGLIAKLGKEVRRPLAATERFVDSLRGMLIGREMQVAYDDYAFDAFRISPLGPPVPIDVMAIRPGMVKLSARIADGLSISVGASKPYLRETVALVEKELADAGRDRSSFRITALAIAGIGKDKDTARGPLPAMLSMFPQATAAYLAKGAVDADALLAAEARGAFEVMKMWTPDAIDQISLVSTPDDLPDALAAYADTGIDELGVMFINPPEEQPELVKLLAAARPNGDSA